ncbi:DNA-binding protein [Vibrio crassostreae]|nr:DNA-binding protein [Vibrio crassostreae]
MNRKEGGSISTRSNIIPLQDLARWNQEKRMGRRTTHNKENVVNRQYHVPQSRLEQALVDYASGQFRFKKEVAKKYKMSAQTLVHHANLRGICFIKKDTED